MAVCPWEQNSSKISHYCPEEDKWAAVEVLSEPYPHCVLQFPAGKFVFHLDFISIPFGLNFQIADFADSKNVLSHACHSVLSFFCPVSYPTASTLQTHNPDAPHSFPGCGGETCH